MGIQYADIIFFAIVAVYLGLKLYSTLGKRDKDDDIISRLTGTAPAEAESMTKKPTIEKVDVLDKREPEPVEEEVKFINTDVESTIKQISARDAGFSVSRFLSGAKMAFEMVVEGYAKKDKETLKQLLSNSIYINFANAIDGMESRGESQETNIISISREEITAASLTGNIARIKVAFVSEQISITKDASGNIIDGDSTAILEIDDEWEFQKDITNPAPNWEIVAV